MDGDAMDRLVGRKLGDLVGDTPEAAVGDLLLLAGAWRGDE